MSRAVSSVVTTSRRPRPMNLQHAPRKRRRTSRPSSAPVAAVGANGSRQRPRVALLIETSNAYARGLLRGIAAYVREHGWSVYLAEHGRGAEAPPWLRSWDGDGIIARI